MSAPGCTRCGDEREVLYGGTFAPCPACHPSARDVVEERIRDVLAAGALLVRIVWGEGDEIADVLVGADSVNDAAWSALRFLLPDLTFAPWDVDKADEYSGASTLEELLAEGERAAARPASMLARSSAGEMVCRAVGA